MEVHKHPHHVTHKKKFGEYFLEFLMIFMAVFLGFLAENWREHIVEKKREKQFVNSLVKDMQGDVSWFAVVSRSSTRTIQHLDSAIFFFSQSTGDKMPVTIYNDLQESMRPVLFLSYNQTLTELKSSGELRLITDRNVVDSLENYDRLLRRLELRWDYTQQIIHDLKQALDKTVIGSDLLDEWKDSIVYQKKNSSNRPVKLNSQNVNELINEIISLRSRIASDMGVYAAVREKAIALIESTKKEYHLNN